MIGMNDKKIFLFALFSFILVFGVLLYMIMLKEIAPQHKWLHSLELKTETLQLKIADEKEPVLYKQVKERYNEWKNASPSLKKETAKRLIKSLETYTAISEQNDHLYETMLMFQELHNKGYISDVKWQEIQMDFLKKNDPIK